MACLIFPFFFPFRSRPLKGGAGIAGKSAASCFGTKRESRERDKPPFSGTNRGEVLDGGVGLSDVEIGEQL